MSKSDTTSDLFELKNFFFLGNYQASINESSGLPKLTESDEIEKKVFIYRNYIAQGNYQIVLDEISNAQQNTALQAVKLLATYLKSENNRDISLDTVKEWMSDGVAANNPTLQLVAGTIYFYEGMYEEAMRCVYQTNTLEGHALLVQIYLKIDRVDQAIKEVVVMQKIDDDATVTQLAVAWVNLALGGEKIQEAYLIYTDLIDKHGASAMLLNGQGVCHMHANRLGEAEKCFLQALEKKAGDPDTLANLITCYQHQEKAQELVSRTINQLKATAPKHPWVVASKKAEDEFDKLARAFA